MVEQLELPLGTPPWVFVKPEHLCYVPKKLDVILSPTKREETTVTINHPSFEVTRQWLIENKYVERGYWLNGDVVKYPFYFNNILMKEGRGFLSAAAMKQNYNLNYNNGNPL